MKVYVTRRDLVDIGENLAVNSGSNFNIIGRQQKNTFWVEGQLQIGNNVGMSATAIIYNYKITIGNDVIIGGNTVIYDTDFHNLNATIRGDKELDRNTAIAKEVIIGNNVFIGAHTTILKGVIIGDNAVVGACSVVSKNIPTNEIWAGNPAKFIRNI
jgi:acetyltransferase-like isoleucine patch superfamily enzyme